LDFILASSLDQAAEHLQLLIPISFPAIFRLWRYIRATVLGIFISFGDVTRVHYSE
jgi:hypothetical protein